VTSHKRAAIYISFHVASGYLISSIASLAYDVADESGYTDAFVWQNKISFFSCSEHNKNAQICWNLHQGQSASVQIGNDLSASCQI